MKDIFQNNFFRENNEAKNQLHEIKKIDRNDLRCEINNK